MAKNGGKLALAPSNVNKKRFIKELMSEFQLANVSQIKNKVDSFLKKYKEIKKKRINRAQMRE